MKTPILILRQAFAITAFVVLILSVNAGCSSGGDDDAVSLPGTAPDQLNYEISQGSGISMTLSQNPSATVTSASLTGSFNRITEAFTLNAQTAAAMIVSADEFLNTLDMELSNDIGENVHFGNYSLHVTSAVAWVGDDSPTSGEIDIRDDPDPVRKITIRVIADADDQGTPGVEITLVPADSPSQSVNYTWELLDGLLDDPTKESYARIASFAYSFLRVVYEQGGLVIQALELLSENDVILELETSGTFVESCDTFPAPADDLNVANPGLSTVFWTDVDNDQSISSGDTVFVDFLDCWDDDPTNTIDTLFNSGIKFVNYIEDQSGGVITRVGFEFVGGDHGFEFWQITETDTQPGVVVIEPDTITLTGGFSMVFTAP